MADALNETNDNNNPATSAENKESSTAHNNDNEAVATEESPTEPNDTNIDNNDKDTNNIDKQTNDDKEINNDNEKDKESKPMIEATAATVVVIEDKSNSNSNINSFNKATEDDDDTNADDEHKEASPTENNKKMNEEELSEKDTVKRGIDNGFGKDFNWEMHEENQRLKEENKEIVEKLKKKEKEIFNLEEALTTLHEELKFLESQEVQSVAKDLAKKNRRLTVQLERERTRAAQIHIESRKLKSELAAYSHHNLSPKKVVEPMSFSERKINNDININDDNDDEQDINNNNDKDTNHDIKEDVNKLKQKLINTKNEVLKYKDMIKRLNIALKKEIGDDTMDINEIIRDGGSWKGRAEKIAILQNKLNETKRELYLLNDIGATNKSNKEKIIIRNKNDEHKHNISQMAVERMKQYENAQIEMEKLHQLNDELKGILKAKNCRIKGLENNTTSMRTKLQFFVEKSKSDDSFIETLQSQLNQQLKLQNSLNKKEKLLNKNNTEITTLSSMINKQNKKMEILNKTIDEMKNKIIDLTQERTDKFQKMFERFDNDDKLYQIQLLETENEKQKDIITTYRKNLTNLQKRLSRKASPRNQDVSINTNRSNKNSKVLQLKEKLGAMTQEQQLIKASYLSIIEGKEQEIEICRQMIKEQSNIHENSINELNKQIHAMKSQILKT